jgi:hypothetical protein
MPYDVEIGRRAIASELNSCDGSCRCEGIVRSIMSGCCEISWRDLQKIGFQLQLAIFLTINLTVLSNG